MTPDVAPDVPAPAEALGRVHFIGIGGAGMSGIARILLARGVPVSRQRRQGLRRRCRRCARWAPRCTSGTTPAHLDGADTVVVSTAVRDDNAELVEARSAGLRVLHRAAGAGLA